MKTCIPSHLCNHIRINSQATFKTAGIFEDVTCIFGEVSDILPLILFSLNLLMLKLKFVLDVFQNGFTSPLYTESLFEFVMSARIYVKNLFSLCEKRP